MCRHIGGRAALGCVGASGDASEGQAMAPPPHRSPVRGPGCVCVAALRVGYVSVPAPSGLMPLHRRSFSMYHRRTVAVEDDREDEVLGAPRAASCPDRGLVARRRPLARVELLPQRDRAVRDVLPIAGDHRDAIVHLRRRQTGDLGEIQDRGDTLRTRAADLAQWRRRTGQTERHSVHPVQSSETTSAACVSLSNVMLW